MSVQGTQGNELYRLAVSTLPSNPPPSPLSDPPPLYGPPTLNAATSEKQVIDVDSDWNANLDQEEDHDALQRAIDLSRQELSHQEMQDPVGLQLVYPKVTHD